MPSLDVRRETDLVAAVIVDGPSSDHRDDRIAVTNCILHPRAAVGAHVMVPDGVFVRDAAGAVTLFETPAPSRLEVAAVTERVAQRMTRWLRRRGLIDERPAEERSNEVPEPSPLEARIQMSLFGGTYLRLDAAGTPLELDDERFLARGKSPWAAELCGFNVHAGVTVRAGDREGLERLFRYGACPPFSLERISLLPDGRVAYRLRKPRRNGATHLVLAPLHFLARISSINPARARASAPAS